MQRRFRQLDVFADTPYRGNPLAVVVDGDGVDDDAMARFANWTNLSETTFLLAPTDPAADYRVRIFTPQEEFPFAGHPTLGSCQAWLDAGGVPRDDGVVVQECGIGLVRIRRAGGRLAFGAPDLLRSGPVDEDLLARLERVVGGPVVGAEWGDNGPGWVVAELDDPERLLSLEPDFSVDPDMKLGVFCHTGGADHQLDVRAFFPGPGGRAEDPVTGSLNASIAQIVLGRDAALDGYVARQGTALGRDGRVHVERDTDGTIWVGGATVTCIDGVVDL